MIRKTMAGFLAALAGSSTVQADECDATVARIVATTGASFVRQTRLVRVLHHPLLGEGLTLYCGPAGLSVSVNWTSAYPPRPVFDLAAKAGAAVTGDPAWLLEPTLTKCHAKALRALTADEPDADADGFRVGRAEMECTAFSHDGGGSSLTVSRRQ